MLNLSKKFWYATIIIVAFMFQMIGLPVNASAANEKEVGKLIKQLEHRISSSRVSAAKRLGEIGPDAKDAVPALAKALNDEDEPVREAASKALRKIGTPEALKALQQYKAGELLEIHGFESEEQGTKVNVNSPIQFQGIMRYPKGRLFLSDGRMIDGKNVIINPDAVSIDTGFGIGQTYKLSEVQQIMVKKGLALKWAGGCGGGCAGLALLSYAASDGSEIDPGQYLLGTLIWVGIFSGVGYAIGYMMDDWMPVYFAPRGAYKPKPLHLGMESSQSENRLVLSYRF